MDDRRKVDSVSWIPWGQVFYMKFSSGFKISLNSDHQLERWVSPLGGFSEGSNSAQVLWRNSRFGGAKRAIPNGQWDRMSRTHIWVAGNSFIARFVDVLRGNWFNTWNATKWQLFGSVTRHRTLWYYKVAIILFLFDPLHLWMAAQNCLTINYTLYHTRGIEKEKKNYFLIASFCHRRLSLLVSFGPWAPIQWISWCQ